jgi:GntR family transcriptional regulator/MocR family aminotransferase
MPRPARIVALPLSLVPSGAPLRHRVADAMIELLRTGQLHPGDTLPATRALAVQLGISRNAVLAAYDELAAAGFVHATGGSSTVVSPGADVAARAGVFSHSPYCSSLAAGALLGPVFPRRHRPAPQSRQDRAPLARSEGRAPLARSEVRWNLMTGYPDTDLIAARDWRAAWRAAAGQPVTNGLSLTSPHRELREALAVHLRRTRGVVADPVGIVLVPGVSAALRALARAAGLAGRTVAFEEPGYAEGRRALALAGSVIRPVPVDEDGMDPAALERGDAAVYTTPAHQYPLGARLSAARRAALIGWAGREGALVIEDDYDGEFRYDVRGLPALHSMTGGPDVVAYVGTASKILSPGLRVAWIVPPPYLLAAVHEALGESEEAIGTVTGHALAYFVSAGYLTRHLARAARTYAARRHALIAGLREAGFPVSGVDAGLHLIAGLPAGTDEDALRERLATAGLAVDTLGEFATTALTRRALVCGYALLPESQATAAAALLAAHLT